MTRILRYLFLATAAGEKPEVNALRLPLVSN